VISHHPILQGIPARSFPQQEGMVVDFLGIKTRHEFMASMPKAQVLKEDHVPYASPGNVTFPDFDDEYFEWIDVLQAAQGARESFTMIELGAGFGRWLVRAVTALRMMNPLPFKLVGVEAEPTHFEWMKMHFLDNGIKPEDQELIRAAVSDSARPVYFHIGNPAGWYGQAIDNRRPTVFEILCGRLFPRLFQFQQFRRFTGAQTPTAMGVVTVPAITLSKILARHHRVDCIDLDLQGSELLVIQEAIEPLNAKVKRIHIGTHSADIEAGLRDLFTESRWDLVNDYRCLSLNATPYGEILFQDGVQTWTNPALNR
jgi:FkbM family methyltransferase